MTEVTAATLNRAVEFDSPFRVNDDGTITTSLPDVYAPECYVPVDDDGQECGPPETWVGWSFVGGWSGQQSYSGPIMHPSEYLGGAMARWVLETPGVYVVCAVETDDDDEDAAGWALLELP